MIRSCICFDIDRNLVALHKFQLFPGRQINQAGSLVTVVPLLGKPQQFALLASIASAQLLCTPDSDIDKSIQELEKLVMITAHPSQQCGNCLNDFRQKAQQELIKRYGDQRLPDVKKDVGK